jgi:hypothetical protein
MSEKRSEHELKALIERAVRDVCGLPRPGLWFCADAVETRGRPPEHLSVRATLHFLPEGAPFCCGEPQCHLGLFGERLDDVADHIRRAMHLKQDLTVEFGDGIGVSYHDGVTFHYGELGESWESESCRESLRRRGMTGKFDTNSCEGAS